MKFIQRGKYQPENKGKYLGDIDSIWYRSSWEKGLMRWLDKNPEVVAWSSERVIVPYICSTDNKPHKYYVDFIIRFKNNSIFLVEVKPESQSIPPSYTNRKKTKTLIREIEVWEKNKSKWEAATEFARQRGYIFQVWSEPHLRKLGILPK